MRIKILLIDDDEDIHLIAKAALEESGMHQVISARTGNEGLKMAEFHSPELILLDQILPDIDGKTLMEELKSGRNSTETPIIFLTGKDDQDTITDLISAGAEAVITKPFNPELLADQITQIMNESK